MATQTRTVKSKRLSLRASPRQKRIFRKVANRRGITVSAFIMESAWKEAQEDIADLREFTIPQEKWKEFVAALDQPPIVKPELVSLFSEASVLEKSK